MQTQIGRRSRQTRQEQRLGFLLRKAIQLSSIAIDKPIAALLGKRLGSSSSPRLQGRQNRKESACAHRVIIIPIPDTNWQVWPCILCLPRKVVAQPPKTSINAHLLDEFDLDAVPIRTIDG